MGKIGTEVAKRAKSFGMNILGFDPYLTEERANKLGVSKASLDMIAEESDFITIHTPLTNETRGIINDAYLRKTKKGVRFVNCARGGIIDEKALIKAIQAGHVAGAALDVEAQAKMQPYLQLGEQMGELVIQLLKKEAPAKIDIDYSGDLIEEDTELLTRTMIKGILSYHLCDSVNLINALHLLKEQGVSYTVQY